MVDTDTISRNKFSNSIIRIWDQESVQNGPKIDVFIVLINSQNVYNASKIIIMFKIRKYIV